MPKIRGYDKKIRCYSKTLWASPPCVNTSIILKQQCWPCHSVQPTAFVFINPCLPRLGHSSMALSLCRGTLPTNEASPMKLQSKPSDQYTLFNTQCFDADSVFEVLVKPDFQCFAIQPMATSWAIIILLPFMAVLWLSDNDPIFWSSRLVYTKERCNCLYVRTKGTEVNDVREREGERGRGAYHTLWDHPEFRSPSPGREGGGEEGERRRCCMLTKYYRTPSLYILYNALYC